MIIGKFELLCLGAGIVIGAAVRIYQLEQVRRSLPAGRGRKVHLTRLPVDAKRLDGEQRRARIAQQLDLYQKHPLFESTIRLLRLKPDIGVGGTIECNFMVVPLAQQMNHEALSYRWGNSTLGKEVCIDGVPFDVTDNLWQALNNFRDTTDGQERIMWIDALCINQDERAPEKNQQISNMHIIYSSAASVKVWLDTGTEESDSVVDHFQHLDIPWTVPPSEESMMDLYLQNTDIWEVLVEEFLLNEWWTRAWIVQEVMLAKAPFLYRGQRSLSFDLLVRLSTFMDKHDLYRGREYQDETTIRSLQIQIRSEMLAYRHRQKHGVPMSLGDWVAQFHNQEASNSRDLVYSFLGLARKDGPDPVIPQYELPLERVFAAGVQYIIEESKSLDFICLGRAPHRGFAEKKFDRTSGNSMEVDVKLPSWVPDLRVRDGFGTILRRPLPLNYGAVENGWNVTDDGIFKSIFNASALHFRGGFDPENMRLSCFGVQVDLIADFANKLCLVNGNFAQDYIYGSVTQQFIRDAEQLLEKTALAKSKAPTTIQALSQPYPASTMMQTWLQAFNKTLMLDLRFDGSRLNTHEGYGYLSHVPSDDFLPREQNPQIRANRWKIHLHRTQHTWSAGRRFVVTETGYMGIANWDARIGDAICILEGASVPFVMRKNEGGKNTWDFVGEMSYLHGFMDGECRQLNLRTDEFHIV